MGAQLSLSYGIYFLRGVLSKPILSNIYCTTEKQPVQFEWHHDKKIAAVDLKK